MTNKAEISKELVEKLAKVLFKYMPDHLHYYATNEKYRGIEFLLGKELAEEFGKLCEEYKTNLVDVFHGEYK